MRAVSIAEKMPTKVEIPTPRTSGHRLTPIALQDAVQSREFSASWLHISSELNEVAGSTYYFSGEKRRPAMDSTETDEVARIIAAFAAQVADRHRPLALIARFRVRPGTGPRIEKAFAEASVQTAREAGVLAYQLHRELDNREAFVVYERWRSLEDLEAHLRTTYIAALREEIDAVMEGEPTFQVMLPI